MKPHDTFVKGLVAAAVVIALAGCDSSDDPATPLPVLDDPIEIMEETTEETTGGATEETTEETTGGAAGGTTEETTGGTAEETTEETTGGTAEETTEETTEESTEETVEEVVEVEPAFPTGLIDGVSVGQTEGTYSVGSPPANVGSLTLNPLDAESQPISIISGGSTAIQVSADAAYSVLYVISDDGGFFTVLLPEAVTESSLVINFSTVQQEGSEAQIGVQVANGEGEVSTQQDVDLTSVVVGTGDLQVSISWDTPTDVDLYLVEPDGTQIFWLLDQSSSGGELDLDSNPGCSIDGVNNENITYDGFVPPSGEYIVGVEYFSACGVTSPTNYVITTRVDGVISIFDGTLLPVDDNGEVQEITRFNFR